MNIMWENLISATATKYLELEAEESIRQRNLLHRLDYCDWLSRHPQYAERSKELQRRLREAGENDFYTGATPSCRYPYHDVLVKPRGYKKRVWRQKPNPEYRNPPKSQPLQIGDGIQWDVFRR